MRTLGVLQVGAVVVLMTLAGCSGKGDGEPLEGDSGGSQSGGSGGAQAGHGPDGAMPGGSPGAPPIGEGCSAVCVPTAQFSVNIVSHADDILNSPIEVCRNDECYQGTFESVATNAQVALTGETWDETRVTMFYQAEPALTVRLSWSLQTYSDEFVDGDRYTLTALTAAGERLVVIDTSVTYERYEFCAGPCTRAMLSLKGPTAEAQGGAGG